jgi:hypothetical protein
MSIRLSSVANDNMFGNTRPASSNAAVGRTLGKRVRTGVDNADEMPELEPTIAATMPL